MKLHCVYQESTRFLTAEYATVATPFGPALMAVSDGHLCWLDFPRQGDGMEKLRANWKGALSPAGTLQTMADAVFSGRQRDLALLLVGTPFQHRVWRGLLNIGRGETLSYGQLAAAIGIPKAARAVGGAVGANPIAWVVPCHRVLASNGSLHGFGCGLPLKEAFLAAEGVKVAA